MRRGTVLAYMETKCWVCLFKNNNLNLDGWINMRWTTSPYINHGVCNQEGCLNRLMELYTQKHATPRDQRQLQEIDHFSRTGEYPDSIFKHVIAFKCEKKFDPQLFLALTYYAITPFMLESFSLHQIINHCIKLLTQKTEHWEFFNLTRCNRNIFFRTKIVNDLPLQLDLDPCNMLPRFFTDQKLQLCKMNFLTRIIVLPELCRNHIGRVIQMSPARMQNVVRVFQP